MRRFLQDDSNAWAARKAAILRIAAKNTSYYAKECSAITSDQDEAAACSKLSFDAAGSAHAAALERQALSKLPSVRVVDAHALTRQQCWATQRDGVHYLPLLPSRLSALTAHVVDCLREQRPPFRGFRGTTHIT